MKTVLELKNVSKEYKQRLAVDSLSFVVQEGEIYGLLGANGAGKSTALKMVTGLAKISAGQIFICGNDIEFNSERALQNIGAIIEYPNFYEYLTGLANLQFFGKLTNTPQADIDWAVEIVGLSSRINERVSHYSLGMKQRLGLAQALMHKPSLLVLDEPTNGLDATAIREVRVLLKKLAKQYKMAILISSHILSEMELLCDKIGIIHKGKLLQQKSIEGIRQEVGKFGSHYIQCNAVNYAGQLVRDNFKTDVKICDNKILFSIDENKFAEAIQLLTKNKILIFSAGETNANLEDVFISTINKSDSGSSIT